jgi:adenylate cyclase
MLAAALAMSGDEAGAKAVAQELLTFEPSFRVSTFVSWYPLQRQDDLSRLAKALRAAGVPE